MINNIRFEIYYEFPENRAGCCILIHMFIKGALDPDAVQRG